MVQSTKLRHCRITAQPVKLVFFLSMRKVGQKNDKFQMKFAPNSECLFTVLFQTNLCARVEGFEILLAHKHKIFASCFDL